MEEGTGDLGSSEKEMSSVSFICASCSLAIVFFDYIVVVNFASACVSNVSGQMAYEVRCVEPPIGKPRLR